MKLLPYQGIDSLRFNVSTQSDAIALYGAPATDRKNRNNVTELHYKDFILRFAPITETLRECTSLPYAKATINNVDVTWDDTFLRQLCKLDDAPRDASGFIVFPALGLAVTGIHDQDESQLAITLFDRSDLEEFVRGSAPFMMPEQKP
jgi:hypothetical protein